MEKYPKIHTLWKRDKSNKHNIIEGDYSKDEFRSICRWLVTEKIDGANIRISYDGRVVIFYGKSDGSRIPSMLLDYLANIFTLDNLGKVFKEGFIEVRLFGEGYGLGIENTKGKGERYRRDNSFTLFDVWIDGWWLNMVNVIDIADKLNVDFVPITGMLTTEDAINLVKKKYISYISHDRQLFAEGIVARANPIMMFRCGDPIMWKLKVKDYDRLGK